MFRWCDPLLLAVFVRLSFAVVQPSFPNGVPGSGYGCDNTCGADEDDTDAVYTIRASLERYALGGKSDSIPGLEGSRAGMFTRTFTGIRHANKSTPFCYGDDDGTTGPLAPCLRVLPGQRVKIRLVNDMVDGVERLSQSATSVERYWTLASQPGQPNLDSITYFGEAPPTPEETIVGSERQNLPGNDATYDDVNLHFHGMQIVPHLFYPQGTGNPSAEWITVRPQNELSDGDEKDQQCFCYVFDIPSDHPQGTFFYHIHRHGSVAMQAWQGMVGLLLVGDVDTPGSPDNDLAKQGITRDEPLVLWEWQIDADKQLPQMQNDTSDTTYYVEGTFLGLEDNTVTTLLTNNAYQPSFSMCVNETVHFRLLCAQTTTGSALYIFDNANNSSLPVYGFASDGISYGTSPVARKAIIVGPGQRESLLVQISKPGRYSIMQLAINDFQDTGEDQNPSSPTAFIDVTTCNSEEGSTDPIDISGLTFTAGMAQPIKPVEVTSQVTVNFQVQSLLDRAPIPQFIIDGKEFDYRRITRSVNATSGSQWTLASNMNYFHPFHVHVNPFQVMGVTSGFLPGNILPGLSFEDILLESTSLPSSSTLWRDTVFIPPYGQTVIMQHFGGGSQSVAWTGKTVFHCHFLDHEDQGMIAAFAIADPNIPSTDNEDSFDGGMEGGEENEEGDKEVPSQNEPTSGACSVHSVGSISAMPILLFFNLHILITFRLPW